MVAGQLPDVEFPRPIPHFPVVADFLYGPLAPLFLVYLMSGEVDFLVFWGRLLIFFTRRGRLFSLFTRHGRLISYFTRHDYSNLDLTKNRQNTFLRSQPIVDYTNMVSSAEYILLGTTPLFPFKRLFYNGNIISLSASLLSSIHGAFTYTGAVTRFNDVPLWWYTLIIQTVHYSSHSLRHIVFILIDSRIIMLNRR